MKNSIDTIGNRSSDLSACSAIPHTTIVSSHNLVFVYTEAYLKILLQQQLSYCFVCVMIVPRALSVRPKA